MPVATDYDQGDWQVGVGYVDAEFGDLGSPAIVGTFTGTTVADVGPVVAEYHPGNRLMRHFSAQIRGQDVWLYTIPSETVPLWTVGLQPPSVSIEVDFYRRGNTDFGLPTYWRHFYGGTANSVNAIEAASLTAAGFYIDGHIPATLWQRWDQPGIHWDASGITWDGA